MTTTTVCSIPSYKTTLASNTKATVTFTSFGIYDLQPAEKDNRSLENISSNADNIVHVSSDANSQASTSVVNSAQQMRQKSKQHAGPFAPQFPVDQLVKKILARPPSLNGPPGPPISIKFVELAPIGSDVEVEDTSDDSVSEAAVSMSSDTSFGQDDSSSRGDDFEMDESVLRPLTVPPWHLKSRRPNVCAIAATNAEAHSPHSVLDGPMRFPF
ncbi:hypothetical protein J3R30DRAFT_3554232 [Lentinula aciculospora]|uniref:Uncharacterized protein n=1 Tax=Lentinula aciculospora TaxID=153920 RepID=A0A9W9DH29_9AGAR|nr:hypothetical protein J3R30DRAFT_3554232 [Lentinula aciculospora]